MNINWNTNYSKKEYTLYSNMFLINTFFHCNKVILRLSIKQHLSLPCISPPWDIVLKYTYNYFLLKSVISLLLSITSWVSRCCDT